MRYWLILAPLFTLICMAGCEKSGYAHCVSVAHESAYNGKWLKHSAAELDTVIKTEECAALEAQLGEADGPKAGKVRWAECLAGPDCDEAGKF